ncbi:hypothetical protein QOT17_018618 [Balamuthia mandrillaris]
MQKTFVLLVLFCCWTAAITSTAVSEDEAFIVLNADTFQLRFVGQNSTAVYALPRDLSTGEIVEEYWTLFTIYNFAEKRCYEIRTENNFASFVSTIGVLDNCSEVERYDIPLAGLPIERAWLEQVDEQSVAFHVLNFGDSNAKLTISYEVIREAEQRSFTNDANTTRTIDILPNSVKISYDVMNYTSQVLSPQQVADGDSYYAFYFYTRFDLSHTIAPFVYPFVTPTYSSPLHPLFSEITETKVAANIMVVDDLFRVKVAQGTFSLNSPATASKQVFNSSEWGFETIDNIIFGYNQSNPEPYDNFFGLEIKMVGARDLVYDPDISVLLTPPGEDEEEDGTEEDGTDDASGTNEREEEDGLSAEEKAIIISVTVVVPTAILILVIAAVVFRLRVAKRKRRNTQMLDKVTSVQQLSHWTLFDLHSFYYTTAQQTRRHATTEGYGLGACRLLGLVAVRTPVSAEDSFIRYDGSVRQREDNPRNFISTIGTLENCTDENFYELDLEQLSVETAQLQQLNDRMVAYTVNGFGNPHSKLIISYEVVEDSEQRLFTNAASTTRTVDINANSLKISFDIQNYTSQVINEHELSNENAYSSFNFHTRFELSHTILPFLYPSTSVSSSPLHPWVEQITEDRIATLIKVDAPFQVQLSQVCAPCSVFFEEG